MFTLKRVKNGAVHYATGVAPSGSVTGLTKHFRDAARLDAATAEKAETYYAGRKNAGTYSLVDPDDLTDSDQ